MTMSNMSSARSLCLLLFSLLSYTRGQTVRGTVALMQLCNPQYYCLFEMLFHVSTTKPLQNDYKVILIRIIIVLTIGYIRKRYI